MFSDIMVPVSTLDAASPALEAAIALAGSRPAFLTVLRLVDLPYPIAGAWVPGFLPIGAGMQQEDRDEAARDVARMKGRLQRAGIPHAVDIVECRESPMEDMAVRHALHADLIVAGGRNGDHGTRGLVVPLLLRSGRPVLSITESALPRVPPRHVLLAWKPAREATRALHDAMDLLETADTVEVVMVDSPEEAMGSHSTLPQLLAHLQRHGVHATTVHVDSGGAPIGEALQRHADRSGAQLIVAGGYEHSRLREWILGGVTRELLLRPGVPVLFSH